jgi:hypothetical protein
MGRLYRTFGRGQNKMAVKVKIVSLSHTKVRNKPDTFRWRLQVKFLVDGIPQTKYFIKEQNMAYDNASSLLKTDLEEQVIAMHNELKLQADPDALLNDLHKDLAPTLVDDLEELC